jgi:hypothetical protein
VFDEEAYTAAFHSIVDGVLEDPVTPTTLNALESGVVVAGDGRTGGNVGRTDTVGWMDTASWTAVTVSRTQPRFSLTVRKVQRVSLEAGECLSSEDRSEMARRRAWWAAAVSEKRPLIA